MKKLYFFCLVILMCFSGCSKDKDNPVEPEIITELKPDGNYNLTMYSQKTLTGYLHIETINYNLFGEIRFDGVEINFGISGIYTDSTILIKFKSNEKDGIYNWKFSGSNDMKSGKIAGMVEAYNETLKDTIENSITWIAQKIK